MQAPLGMFMLVNIEQIPWERFYSSEYIFLFSSVIMLALDFKRIQPNNLKLKIIKNIFLDILTLHECVSISR